MNLYLKFYNILTNCSNRTVEFHLFAVNLAPIHKHCIRGGGRKGVEVLVPSFELMNSKRFRAKYGLLALNWGIYLAVIAIGSPMHDRIHVATSHFACELQQ